MKPLTLTIWILAHNHLAEWCTKTITICRLFHVVSELLLFGEGGVYYAVCYWRCVIIVGRYGESAALCTLTCIPPTYNIIHHLHLPTSISNHRIIPTPNTLPPLIIKHLPLLLCLLFHFRPELCIKLLIKFTNHNFKLLRYLLFLFKITIKLFLFC